MKPPEPSATHCVPPASLEEERTGQFRLSASLEDERTGKFRLPAHRRRDASPVEPAAPVQAVRHRRVLIAAASEDVIQVFLPIISALDAAVVKVEDGAGLSLALSRRGPFDLVLSDSLLPGGTGLGILAGLRSSGHRPPFVIVQSLHSQLVRVVVGGGKSSVLSTRVVNDLALLELVEDLLGFHDSPASSRRPQRIA